VAHAVGDVGERVARVDAHAAEGLGRVEGGEQGGAGGRARAADERVDRVQLRGDVALVPEHELPVVVGLLQRDLAQEPHVRVDAEPEEGRVAVHLARVHVDLPFQRWLIM